MRIAVMLALAGLVLAAGCGGGNEDGRKRFAKDADAICAKYQERISRIPGPQDPRDPLQLELFLRRTLPLVRSQNAELRRLDRPEEDGPRIARLLAALDVEADYLARARAAARRENLAAAQGGLTQSQIAAEEAGRVGKEIGLGVCGTPS